MEQQTHNETIKITKRLVQKYKKYKVTKAHEDLSASMAAISISVWLVTHELSVSSTNINRVQYK